MNSEETLLVYGDKITFFHYCLEKQIISKEEITKWADKEIMEKDDLPYFIIELSLANSCSEQSYTLSMPFSDQYKDITYNILDVKSVLSQIRKAYDAKERTILEIINILYDMDLDLLLYEKDIYKELVDDINVIDYYGEEYADSKLSLKDLDEKLNAFFDKYL